MVDFSSIFIVYEFLKKALGVTSFSVTPDGLFVFAAVVLGVLALSFIIPRQKDSTRLSLRNFLRVFAYILGFIWIIACIVCFASGISAWGYAALGLGEVDFWVAFCSLVFAAAGIIALVARQFMSKEPNNESGLNGRQKAAVVGFVAFAALVVLLSWRFTYSAFEGVVTVILIATEAVSIIFWFYDPIIYILSRFFSASPKPAVPPTPGKLNRFAILGCAHNEEQVIGRLVESIYATTYTKEKYDVFVICDNCTDNTADVVIKAGAAAMVRNDAEKRGKGFALEWMFGILEKKRAQGDEYDAYIVLDADNLVNEQYLDEINSSLNEGYEIMQTYLGCKNPGDTWVTKCYSLAYWLSNSNYQDAHSRLGLSAQMGGTGMVIRPSVLEEIGWRTDSLTEDLVLTTSYVGKKNRSCRWVHQARLYDEKPLKVKASTKQRTRWMQGHMNACFKQGLPLFLTGIKNLSFRQMDVALYLMRPFLNFIMFVTYMLRIAAILFVPTSFMASTFLMDFNAAVVLLLAYLMIQLYILAEEKYLRYAPWIPLQWIYTYTWYGPIFRGIIKNKELFWVSTVHQRGMSINEVRVDVQLTEARRRLEGLDNLHRLPLGQVLLKAAAITNEQLQSALKLQKERGGFLGDVLVDMGAIDAETLDAYLKIQQSVRAEAEQSGKVDQRLQLGQVLLDAGVITNDQLETALKYQRQKKVFLGEALIGTGALTPELLNVFLEVQKLLDVNYVDGTKAHALVTDMMNYGGGDIIYLLKSGGLVTNAQLDAAEQYRRNHGGELVDILIAFGYVSRQHVNTILTARNSKNGQAPKGGAP